MDGEAEEGRMNEQRFILSVALKECEKKAGALNKRKDILSYRLGLMDDSNSSVRQRAGLRSSLSTVCEERDRWQNRIDIINKWMKEIE